MTHKGKEREETTYRRAITDLVASLNSQPIKPNLHYEISSIKFTNECLQISSNLVLCLTHLFVNRKEVDWAIKGELLPYFTLGIKQIHALF